MAYAQEPLHPQSYETLRQFVKLHGAERLITAIREIEQAQQAQRGKP